MDINGPTRIGNGELHPVINHTSKLTDIRSSKDNLNYIFTAGRREEQLTENVIPETFGYASIDSGRTWSKITIENNDANRDNNIHIFAVDDKAYTITDNFRIHRYNFSTGVMDLSNQLINDIHSSSIFVKNFQNSDPVILISGKSTVPPYTNKIYYTNVDANFKNISSLNGIDNQASDTKASDGYGNIAYFVGNGIQVVDTTNQIPVLKNFLSVLAPEKTYTTVSAFNTNMAVAAGKNIINYTIDGGINWTPIYQITINGNSITEFDIKRLHMLPDGKGLAIGTYNNDTNGFIIYTQYLNNWKSIPEEIAFYSFGNEDVLRQPSINNVCISKDGSFVFTNVTKEVSGEIDDNSYDSGSSTIYYGLYPAVFDVYNNNVLDVNGGMSVNGQILQF